MRGGKEEEKLIWVLCSEWFGPHEVSHTCYVLLLETEEEIIKPTKMHEIKHLAPTSHTFTQASRNHFFPPCAGKLIFLGNLQVGTRTQIPTSVPFFSSLAPLHGSNLSLMVGTGTFTATLVFGLTGPVRGPVCLTSCPR